MLSVAEGNRGRSKSPTTALWNGRREAREKMSIMANMGLHVFHPEWQAVQPGTMPRGREYSTSFKTTTLKIFGSEERLSFPVQTCTKVADVKDALARSLMVSPESIDFIEKCGCSTRKQRETDEIATTVTVKGISSFKPRKHEWPHPVAIIGAGYNGLKTCMMYAKAGDRNFICFDRFNKVGGYCWITAANKTSKLQTEFGSFHVWWGEDMRTEACNYPAGWDTWPKKDKVLAHFHYAAEQYGVLPNIQFNSNVAKMDMVGERSNHDHYYNLTVMPVDGGDAREVACSVMYNFPGCMTRNRIIEYPGEDVFDGHIAYGMNDDCPYDELGGKTIAILGNGAFAVENARTASEYAAKKVFIVTRRKNLASPRVACWFVHQGPVPTPGRLVLDMFKPMYDLAGFGDPWDYWSVHASADRSKVNVIQSSRFGIADVTFLAVMYGKLEYVEDTLKRLTRNTLHLTSGRKLEDVSVILKSLGLLGDFAVDRLHKMKHMVGNYCDGDWRRVLLIDAIGMNAANFTTFSTGIGSHGFISTHKFLHDHPKEYYRLQELGLLQQLPTNKADEQLDKPAYVFDVKYAMSASVILEMMCPKLAELSVNTPEYKYRMYHAAHPIDRYLEECIADWDKYQKMWTEQGCIREYVPYPYTKEMIEGYFADYAKYTGVPAVSTGPPADAPDLRAIEPGAIGAPPAWINDEAALTAAESQVKDQKDWWSSCGNQSDLFQRREVSIGPEVLALRGA